MRTRCSGGWGARDVVRDPRTRKSHHTLQGFWEQNRRNLKSHRRSRQLGPSPRRSLESYGLSLVPTTQLGVPITPLWAAGWQKRWNIPACTVLAFRHGCSCSRCAAAVAPSSFSRRRGSGGSSGGPPGPGRRRRTPPPPRGWGEGVPRRVLARLRRRRRRDPPPGGWGEGVPRTGLRDFGVPGCPFLSRPIRARSELSELQNDNLRHLFTAGTMQITAFRNFWRVPHDPMGFLGIQGFHGFHGSPWISMGFVDSMPQKALA
eukprot:gene8600-biopygen1612